MRELQNIVVQDQGANWTVSFEYKNDTTPDWTLYEASFPGDFSKIGPRGLENVMLELALAVARGDGVDV